MPWETSCDGEPNDLQNGGEAMNLEKLPFLLFDELDFEEENEVSRLLAEHAELREELERLRVMLRVVEASAAEPPPGLLSQCRTRLHATLRDDSVGAQYSEPGRRSWWQAWFANGFAWQTAGALAMAAFSFLAGRWTVDRHMHSVSPSEMLVAMDSDSSDRSPWTPRIRSIRNNPDGTVQVEIEEVKQRLVIGSPDDREVRAVLLNAAQNTLDPGLRVGTIDLLQAQMDRPDVRDVLLHVVRKDGNPSVRLKALEGLVRYSDESSVREALRDVLLRDQNPTVRMEAVNLLIQEQGRPEVIGLLQEVMLQEENHNVRERCMNVLTDLNATMATF
jgi:hypothetical protein